MSLLPFLLFHQIVINEVVANPKGSTGPGCPEDRNEFVELFNLSPHPIDLLGWRISDFDAKDTIVSWQDSSILLKYPTLKINTTSLPSGSYALILDREYTETGNGEYLMPYNFPESLVVITVGNTTIGDELAMNDSLILYSPDSTFVSTFSFPRRTEDGFSLERIRPEAEDKQENWVTCLDTTGSTPGFTNSTITHCDPKITNLQIRKETKIEISLLLSNPSFGDLGPWWIDLNLNRMVMKTTQGSNLSPRSETLISFSFDTLPKGENEITARLSCPRDRDTSNNFLTAFFLNLAEEELVLSPPVFTDTLAIALSLKTETDLLIEVFDLKGRKVREVYKGKYKEGEKFLWDGRDEKGEKLDRGIYLVVVNYKKNGNWRLMKKSCVLGNKPPTPR